MAQSSFGESSHSLVGDKLVVSPAAVAVGVPEAPYSLRGSFAGLRPCAKPANPHKPERGPEPLTYARTLTYAEPSPLLHCLEALSDLRELHRRHEPGREFVGGLTARQTRSIGWASGGRGRRRSRGNGSAATLPGI